jgi:retinol dehydrogenase-12
MGFFGLGSSRSFMPDADIMDLSGRVIFITGGRQDKAYRLVQLLTLTGNNGLGKQSAIDLAKHKPDHIYLAARSSEKAHQAIKDIQAVAPHANVTFIACDLASLASVQRAARQFNGFSSRLDILFNNAGVMALPPSITEDGYEIQFGTNHVGHALLTKLLLPTLLKTVREHGCDVRIINLSSDGHNWTPLGGIAFQDLRSPQKNVSTWARYGQSKLANILYASELARRYPEITSVSVHPGLVNTNLNSIAKSNSLIIKLADVVLAPLMKTPMQGALNQLWAATATRDEVANGEYYSSVAIGGKRSKDAKSETLAGELWDWTQKELENY